MKGFLSYARDDDRTRKGAKENGKISKLREEFEIKLHQTLGEKVTLIQDKEHSPWSKEWLIWIEEEIKTSGFLLAILTPCYFKRKFCIYEFMLARELDKPIFSIYYREDDLIEDDQFRNLQIKSKDEAKSKAACVAKIATEKGYKDFRELINKPLNCEKIETFLDHLAKELIDQMKEIQKIRKRKKKSRRKKKKTP